MIGGAELEPGSAMYSPHNHDVHTIQAAITERRSLAAEYHRNAADGPAIHAEVERRNAKQSEGIAKQGCKKHVGGASPWDDSVRGDDACPQCKAARSRYISQTKKQFGYDPSVPTTVAAVRGSWTNMAQHFDDSAKALEQHLRSRRASLN